MTVVEANYEDALQENLQKHAGYPNDPDTEERKSGDGQCWVQGVNGVWVGQLYRDPIGDIHEVEAICLYNAHEHAAGTEPRIYWKGEKWWSMGDTLWTIAERMDLMCPKTFKTLPHPLDWVYEPERRGGWSRHGRERDWGNDGVVCNLRDRMKWIRTGRVARAPRSESETNFDWALEYFRKECRIREVDGKECRELEAEFKEYAKYNWHGHDGQSGGPRCQAWSDRITLDDGKPYISWFDWKKRVSWKVEKLDKKMTKFTFSFYDHALKTPEWIEVTYPIPRLIEALKVGAEPAAGEQSSLF